MISLREPALDWVKLSEGMASPPAASTNAEDFAAAFRAALAERGRF